MTRRHSAPAPVEDEETGPERLYVITGGRGGPSGSRRIDLVTLVVSVGGIPAGLFPEHTAILRLCAYPLSAAEISAHLRLPFSATAVLVDDLAQAGLVVVRQPRNTAVFDPHLIREVLRGLQRL
jgi:Protein of unknown function (DUF742)